MSYFAYVQSSYLIVLLISMFESIPVRGYHQQASFCLALQRYEENTRHDLALLDTTSPAIQRSKSPKLAAALRPERVVNPSSNWLAKLFLALPIEQQNDLLTDLAHVGITAASFWADAATRGTLCQTPFERVAHYRCWFLRQGYTDVFELALAELKLTWP